jgi:hypothetical protein
MKPKEAGYAVPLLKLLVLSRDMKKLARRVMIAKQVISESSGKARTR